MKRMSLAIMALFTAFSLAAPVSAPAAPPNRYAEGQVWEYKTRPQDSGSLLKIQRVEDGGSLCTIYHISIVGLVIGGHVTNLTHSPVSRTTLDASVTRLSNVTRDWPKPDEGIAEWRAAKGCVFTIPVAKIADIMDQAVMRQRAVESQGT